MGQKRKRAELPDDPQEVERRGQNPATNKQSMQPVQTPSPAAPQQAYVFPQFNRQRSHSGPTLPSPTNDLLKRKKAQSQQKENQPDQESRKGQDMVIDEEERFPADQNKTPIQLKSGGDNPWQYETPTHPKTPTHERGQKAATEQEVDTFVEVNELENAKTLARVLNTDEETAAGGIQPTYSHPIDKYTRGPFPGIYDEDPATLLAGLNTDQLQSWLNLATGKVLARPFDLDVNYQPNHNVIAKAIRSAVKEITGAVKVTVAPPTTNRDHGPKPITFLIHDITKKDAETLLERSVWSCKEISFQVAAINVKRPDFLFTLEGMTTDNPDQVMTCIADIWDDVHTYRYIHKLADMAANAVEQQESFSEMMEFLQSVWVQPLDVRSTGGQEDPHYNVYADGEAIKNNKTWLDLRTYLRSRTYKSNLHGNGRAKDLDFVCSLCHGHDHPRGLCKFPRIPGWNGGGRNPKIPSALERRAEHAFPDQHRVSARGNPHGQSRGRGYGRGPGRGRGQNHPYTGYNPHNLAEKRAY